MKSITPYLNYNGNAEKAMMFYKDVFGGEFIMFEKFSNMPDNENLSSEDLDKIMHISLKLPNGLILFASDVIEGMGNPFLKGNNISLMIETDSRENVDRLFQSLSEGGNIAMEPAEMFWGDYFTSFTDKFGIPWMLSYSEESDG